MRTTRQFAFRRGGCLARRPFHIAPQHGFPAAAISPNPETTPPAAHFFGPTRKPQAVLLQSSFHQLLQIVTGVWLGCVRLTYRNPGQVWHKRRVCPASVQRSDRAMAAMNSASRQHWPSRAPLASRPTRRSVEIKKAPPNRKSGSERAHREEAFGSSDRNMAAPTTWGLATGTNLGYSSLRVA